jgi:hypothetical protein
MLSERFEMRFTADLLGQIDEWRRQQDDLPARAEAIRRLIEAGLSVAGKTEPSGSGSEGKGKTKPASRAKTTPTRSAPPNSQVSKEAHLGALRENRA